MEHHQEDMEEGEEEEVVALEVNVSPHILKYLFANGY